MNTQSKSLAMYAILFSLLLSGCGAAQIFSSTVTPTVAQTNTPESTPTSTLQPTQTSTPVPAAYHVKEASGPFTDAQIEINSSESAKDQQVWMQRWLDYWVNFENRPFTLDTSQLSWKYIYDKPSPEDPSEVIVIMEAGGEYGGKLFSIPIIEGVIAENPPEEVAGKEIPVGYGPLELNARAEGQWLSVDNGILVRKDGEGKIIERLNMQTKQWEIVKPKIEVVVCTPDNFLQNEVSVESLFDGSYLEALRNKAAKAFDPATIKNDVPMANYIATGNGPNAGTGEITYSFKVPVKFKTPNFPIRGTEPFRRYLTGFTTYQGIVYAVVPTEYFNPQNPDQNVWVLTLFRFDKYDDTDAKKVESMKIWKDRMNVTPILSTNHIPDTRTPDALVARTFSKPDIQQRIDSFVNHNSFKPDGTPINSPFKLGGDIAALDGEVFLTNIHVISLPVYK